MHIYIETYGCASSQNDTEIMKGLLSKDYDIVDDIEKADIIIINTCIVKQSTEQKTVFRIEEIQRKYPKKELIIAGCMPEAEFNLAKRIAPKAKMISTNHINRIVEVVEGKKQVLVGKDKKPKICLPKVRKNKIVSIIEICSGCNHECSYCITKFAKGDLLSYPAKKIVYEFRKSYEEGCREFWLTGQDIAAYNDKGIRLPQLLERIIQEVKGKYLMRLGMMNPANVLPILNDLVKVYKNEHIFKFLHTPVQSGSDKILKSMKRGYTVKDFRRIIDSFKDITLWTDVIVGFPGESDKDFRETVKLLEKTRPDFINVSRFGPRPGTKAEKMEQISTDVKKERSRTVSGLVDKYSLEKNKKWLNWKGEVLIDEYNKKKRTWIGRNPAYKPVVLKGEFKTGDFVKVNVVGAERTHLKGNKG